MAPLVSTCINFQRGWGSVNDGLLLVAKVQLKVVSERLRHASIATTADIYSHVLPEMQQEVVEKIDGLFKQL